MIEILIWFIPLLFSGICLALKDEKLIKLLALLALILVLFLSIQASTFEGIFEYSWIPQLGLNFTLLFDFWSKIFVFVISIISISILIYSFLYIKEGIRRYYSLYLLFVGSMIGFVLAGNFFQLLIFWELIGVCSYLLIGFYYKREKAINAGLKAVLITKVGDLCLFLAILLFFLSTNSLSLIAIQNLTLFQNLISFLFVIAILTKSAQFPFYFWLADAMEGPTTVSALLHSSTMVKAGVFLLIRISPLLNFSSLLFLSLCSVISLIIAGILALSNYDIKRVLAFSTITQISFMLLAIVFLSNFSGFLHLINHAFFKALLFLCAGIIIHLSRTRNLNKMKISPRSFLSFSFLVGILSLAGIPPFNGFWSKELMFDLAFSKIFLITVFSLGTLLTVLYSLRLILKIFRGKLKPKNFHLM
jgi:NADH-quinone oxidoreductase subunit L